MRKTLLIFISWLFLFHSAKAQHSENIKDDSLKNFHTGKYLKFGTSIGFASLRDRGNSPWFYKGLVTSTGFSLYNVYPTKEFEIGFDLTRGQLSIPNSFLQYAQSFSSVSFHAYKLWKVAGDNHLAIKLGPGIQSQLNHRVNHERFNTYTTMENFTALNVHAKAEINFARPAKSGKFLSVFKYKKPERKYNLAYHFTGSVLPFSYRPGYAYVGDIVTDYPHQLDDHSYFLGGYQVSNEISLTRYLSDGNAFRISYEWDVIASSPSESRYNMAQHSLKLAWMFNYKK